MSRYYKGNSNLLRVHCSITPQYTSNTGMLVGSLVLLQQLLIWFWWDGKLHVPEEHRVNCTDLFAWVLQRKREDRKSMGRSELIISLVFQYLDLKNLHWNPHSYGSETFNYIYPNTVGFIDKSIKMMDERRCCWWPRMIVVDEEGER